MFAVPQLYGILCVFVISLVWPFCTATGQSTAAITIVCCSAYNITAFTLEFSVFACKIAPFEAFYILFFAKLNK